LFGHWLDQQHASPRWWLSSRSAHAYKQTHPGDDFALLHHREQTLLRRFQALLFAPLWGIDRLSALIPTSIRSRRCLAGLSKLNARQFLGNLSASDRRGPAADAGTEQVGQIIDVDGHRIAIEPASMPQGQDHHAGPHHGGLASRDCP